MNNDFKEFFLVDPKAVVGIDLNTGMVRKGKVLANCKARKPSSARQYFEGLYIGYYEIREQDGTTYNVRLNMYFYTKERGNLSMEDYKKESKENGGSKI